VGGIIDPWDVGDQDSPRSLATRSQSSLSEQISIDTSSDSDIDSDIDGGLVYTHSMQLTPGGAVARSYRSSHYMDGRSGKPGSEDFSESPADLLLSSPIRQMQPSTRRSQQLLSAADARDGMARAGARSMLGSLHRLHSQHRRESSAEDDELDPHEPDLHFGQSDTGSDAENASSFNNHGTGPAAVLPHTSTAASAAATTADTPADASPRGVLSAVALSSAAASGLSMTRTRTAESGVDVGGGGDSAAMVLSPPENIATFWKAISNLLMAPDTSQLFQIGLDLVYPLGPTEHVMPGSPIIVREAEPSSIIAYTLLNDEFRKILHALFEEARSGGDVGPRRRAHDADDASSAGSGESFDDDLEERSPLNEFSQAPPSRDDGEDIKRVLLQAQEHVYFEFSAGRKKFTCEVYYAAQFEALRRCNGCEDSYIESLSRCMPYSAKGGKSGSAFMLTRDRRFIAKHVSKAETKAFLKFAPSYFEHMYWNWLYRDNRPSVLAKIFGFCCVTLPNAAGGKPVKLNVMIMENLFYGRNCSPVFDLKGSERNRMVDDKGTNAVFQDENLVKFIRDRPICIRQQTKRHLHDAIWNDTLFLSKMNVMDYSLLVGFDAGSNQLVVGIIDFIRTFTCDKKLESWVKEAGILGGGKGPTIVSPKQYKNRFREAMERYFLTIPDKFYES
ncbi:Mitochondrial distribution and morphology protein 12, partial [Coemansia biformis]